MGSQEAYLDSVEETLEKINEVKKAINNPLRTETCKGCGQQDYKDVEHLVYKCNYCGRLADDRPVVKENKNKEMLLNLHRQHLVPMVSLCDSLDLDYAYVKKHFNMELWPEGIPMLYNEDIRKSPFGN